MSGLDRALLDLSSSSDRELLVKAAVTVATSGNSGALDQLQASLGRKEFLARLDDLSDPQQSMYHLRQVMLALESNPTPATERLCLALAADADFKAEPGRLSFLLAALSAGRPMSAEVSALFRRMNREGFFAWNAPLLVRNASPRALAVFEEMIFDKSVKVDERVDAVHRAVVPVRNSLEVLKSIERMLGRSPESAMEIALIESVFDYQQQRWFGRIANPPSPPPWDTSSVEVLAFVSEFGRRVENRTAVPDTLRQAVRVTLESIGKAPRR
jgi:hypothetical protein